MAAPARRFYTIEEYFAIEEESDARHEYYAGDIVAMAGGSRWHDRLTMNLTLAVADQVRSGPCVMHTGNMRVRADEAFVYPDLSVTCGGPRYQPGGGETLLNPTAVFEVLSPSTERFDRGRKFELYQGIESLIDYVLISQSKVRVEHFVRGDDQWVLKNYNLLEQVLSLRSLACEISIREIYEGIDFASDVE